MTANYRVQKLLRRDSLVQVIDYVDSKPLTVSIQKLWC
jgi:hypothetical protein